MIRQYTRNPGALDNLFKRSGNTVVYNDQGNDVDLRAEGSGDANLFYLDAGNDRVGVGTASPGAKLDVNGDVHVSGGSLFVGATSNANVTLGLVLDMAANDDHIVSLLSTGDVAHGITSRALTNEFGFISKASGISGGLSLEGFSDSTLAMQLVAAANSGVTTTSTAASAASTLVSAKKSGTGLVALAANENVHALVNWDSTRHIFKGNGDVWFDGHPAFNGVAIGTQATGYTTFGNLTTDRTLDADSTTLGEVADVLGTLIEDLKETGIIGA